MCWTTGKCDFESWKRHGRFTPSTASYWLWDPPDLRSNAWSCISSLIFLIAEGPRSRRYRRTAAFGLIVMKVMMMIIIVVLFLVRKHRWNEIDWGKPKYSGKTLSQCHFVHHKSHKSRDRTRASAVGGRRLTA
jgi:hypothetical protein